MPKFATRRAWILASVIAAVVPLASPGSPALASPHPAQAFRTARHPVRALRPVPVPASGDGAGMVVFGPGSRRVHLPATALGSGPVNVRWRPGPGAPVAVPRASLMRRAPAGDDGTGRRYRLAVSAIGRNGKPANVSGLIFDAASKDGHLRRISTPGGTGHIRLPAGRYLITAGAGTGRIFTEYFVPFRVGKGHTHLTLDGRKTRLVRVSLDGKAPAAAPQFTALAYWSSQLRTADLFPISSSFRLYVLPVHARYVVFSSQWDIYGRNRAGIYHYVLAVVHTAGVPADPAYHFTTASLAVERDAYRGQDAGARGAGTWAPLLRGMLFTSALQVPTALPRTITYYLLPHAGYFGLFDMGNINRPDETVTSTQQFRPGAQAQVWNAAAIGPRVPAGSATRTGNTLTYHTTGFFTDAAPPRDGHIGLDYAATGTISLARGGKTVGTAPFRHAYPHPGQLTARLPSAPARYTLRVSASRQPRYAALSTQVTMTWSFSSARTAARSALPLTTVRYQIPGLDAQNQAQAGTTVHVPVWAQRQPGAAAARVTRLTVQESADGGRTWHPVPLARAGDHWVATIANPAAPGYVALRATVADSAGNTATQTILRAYAVTRRGSSR